MLHPATICRRDSGIRQKLQSGEEERPHFERFFLVESVLLMYLTVKMNTFFGKFDWAEDQMELNFRKECNVTGEKKEP